jgi:F0F1-type ATP synthase assembly protein I
MPANHPPRTVRTTRRPHADPTNRMSIAAGAERTWPGMTTAQSLAVASQFGVSLAVGVALGIFAGQWLDNLLHSGILLTLIGAFIGLVAGITSIVALYRATLRKSELEWRHEVKVAAAQDATSQKRNE